MSRGDPAAERAGPSSEQHCLLTSKQAFSLCWWVCLSSLLLPLLSSLLILETQLLWLSILTKEQWLSRPSAADWESEVSRLGTEDLPGSQPLEQMITVGLPSPCQLYVVLVNHSFTTHTHTHTSVSSILESPR